MPGESRGLDVHVCAGAAFAGAAKGMGVHAGNTGARTQVERARSRWMLVHSSVAISEKVSDSLIIEVPPVLRL